MLVGKFSVSIDEKARVVIPSKLKSDLSDRKLYLTFPIDSSKSYIVLYPEERFKEIAARINAGVEDSLNVDKNKVKRYVLGNASELELDSAGRINIPEYLREKANITLKSEVVISGCFDSVEIWSKEGWNKDTKESEADIPNQARKLIGDI